MIENLTQDQIDHVLTTQVVGRVGCSTGKKIHIVPTVYVYQNGYIYAHSKEGEKISIMRKNPRVCFQVDAIESLNNWRSVMIHGQYEELTGKSQQAQAVKLLLDRFTPLKTSSAARPSRDPEGTGKIEKLKRAVLYRISVDEKTGRYEKD